MGRNDVTVRIHIAVRLIHNDGFGESRTGVIEHARIIEERDPVESLI